MILSVIRLVLHSVILIYPAWTLLNRDDWHKGSGLALSSKIFRVAAALVVLLALMLAITASGAAGPMVISIVSSTSAGAEGDGNSRDAAVSADGRYVVFYSQASDLSPDDTNGAAEDIFLKDTLSGFVALVSTNADGVQANNSSIWPSISADGRYVSFRSWATNLVVGESDINNHADIFVKDLQTGAVDRVSDNSFGEQADDDSGMSDISDDGRYVAFESTATNLGIFVSDANGVNDVLVHDRQQDITFCISCYSAGLAYTGNSSSADPSISADGRYVAFSSWASNLSGADSDATRDIYIRDIQASPGNFTIASTSTGGQKGNGNSSRPDISADGRYVVFESSANNLVVLDNNNANDIFRKDLNSGATSRVSAGPTGIGANGDSIQPSVSDDGRYVAFLSSATSLAATDGNGAAQDVFVKDMVTGGVSLVSTDPAGNQPIGGILGDINRNPPEISGDGRYVAFCHGGGELVNGDFNGADDIFITRSGPNVGFTWYDNIEGADWVLMANPASATSDSWFDLAIGGALKGLAGSGQVAPGDSLTPRFDGLRDGPVEVSYHSAAGALSSQRILWPAGGSSLEEVLGMDSRRFSDHFYWTWYDQTSAGYTNWVLVANPGMETITAQVSFKNLADGLTVSATGDILPGESWTPTFPGKMGGPVEVKTYRQGGDWNTATDRRAALASQRVLSSFGSAFNEVMGVPVEELSNDYLWSWYDNTSVGARNWILVANPPGAGGPIGYEIWIGASKVCDDLSGCAGVPAGSIAPGGNITPMFSAQGGPVEVKTYVEGNPGNPADSIASQRIIWGPSFGETLGSPRNELPTDHHWTWYDQQSAGMSNWVLIANPMGSGYIVRYEIWIGGTKVCDEDSCAAATPGSWQSGALSPGEKVTPTFDGTMDGPVEVRTFSDSGHITYAPSISSQRVLYNGFFNEVTGTDLS